ncbi:MAG: glycosyltransferase family 39 protein, partial [Myxococcota bacterium]
MNPKRFALSLFAVAWVVRLVALLWVGDLPTIRGYECEEISRSLLAGEGYAFSYHGPVQPTAHQYPLYCWLMAGHFAAFGFHYLPLQLTQTVIGAGTCVLLWILAARITDERIGRIAGVLCALYPVYVYWAVRLQALTVEIALLIGLM